MRKIAKKRNNKKVFIVFSVICLKFESSPFTDQIYEYGYNGIGKYNYQIRNREKIYLKCISWECVSMSNCVSMLNDNK